ncbi:hypothetical protein ETB97_003693 [Aspergillus alliaceus]|uniref:Uncharacterized protein n=1 Tax=Petromyces alliaceus TaxID=209559 RepID=A0A5N7C000_PETAA|nr:hypothetical protein BDV23DRAFT_161165 [Aspergillus alliaceus]KAF5865435.1 hypothetical protein ETB97_003693 [Aspergillus burnettii]
MVYSLYDGTIVMAKSALTSLAHILHQAEQLPNATDLLTARLQDDMKPLTSQIHIATQVTEKMIARLTGREHVVFDENLKSFTDLHERLQNAITALNEADKDIVNRRGEEVEPTTLGPDRVLPMSGAAFVNGTAIPNIFFHLTIAYAILRKEGVPLGKRDYIMSFVGPQLAGSY